MIMFIWWLDQLACQCVVGTPRNAPDYLKKQFEDRLGRPGRGRLWVADQFGEVAVDPWPDTPLAKKLGGDWAGIVIRDEDKDIVIDLPGIVTDMQLNRVS